MSEIKHMISKYKDGTVAGEGDLELPTSFAEITALISEEEALSMVKTQMQVKFNRGFKQKAGSSLLPKSAAAEIRAAVQGGVDIKAVLEEVRRLREEAA